MTLFELRYAPDSDLTYGEAYWIREWGMKSPKYVFLHKSAVFLRRVLKELDLKSKVHKSPGGIAVHGDANIVASLESGKILYVCVTQSTTKYSNCALFWRVGDRPYATDGTNHWIEEDCSPKEIAARIAKHI